MREPRLLQISQLGHPVLRETCKPVADIAAAEIQQLIDDMIATAGSIVKAFLPMCSISSQAIFRAWRERRLEVHRT